MSTKSAQRLDIHITKLTKPKNFVNEVSQN